MNYGGAEKRISETVNVVVLHSLSLHRRWSIEPKAYTVCPVSGESFCRYSVDVSIQRKFDFRNKQDVENSDNFLQLIIET